MDRETLRELLLRVQSGAAPVDEAVEALRDLPFRDVGDAVIDTHRALRQGVPEVIFGEPKTAEQIVLIAGELRRLGQSVMITRLSPEKAAIVKAAHPELVYQATARIGSFGPEPRRRPGEVCVVTAGTSDAPIAEEAAETLRLIGVTVNRVQDVGVAGLHRILGKRDELGRADVVIVVAGMEGALPSVVGGLVAAPVIAVPTTVGYGAHLAGFTPLFAMLTSCASGIAVVNIDNGFGAAMAAHRILLSKHG